MSAVSLVVVFVLVASSSPVVATGPPIEARRVPTEGGSDQAMVMVEDAAVEPMADQADGVVTPGSSVFVASVDRAHQVAADARVRAILDRTGPTVGTAIASSVPATGAPDWWADGSDGAGQVVVVIDTGVAADFGGEVVGQACFAASVDAGGDLQGHCGEHRNELAAFDATCFELGVCSPDHPFDDDAARPCGFSADPSNACSHGSAVAAVAARRESPRGVAPEAGVYAIQVFDGSGSSAALFDVALALDHAIRLRSSGLPVAAVNLSVATDAVFRSGCLDPGPYLDAVEVFRELVTTLADLGVPTTVAAGNGGHTGWLSFPACLRESTTVSAADLVGVVPAFSNVAAGVDVLAPGLRSVSPLRVLQIPSGTDHQLWQGTSFAAPHVAGGFAVLRHAFPHASTEQLEWAVAAGSPLEDTNRGSFRLFRLGAAHAILYGRAFVPKDRVPVGGAQGQVGDFDGDGFDDFITYTPGTEPDGVIYGGDTWDPDRIPLSLSYPYVLLAGQFYGDVSGPDDLLLYGSGSNTDKIWAGEPDRTFTSRTIHIPEAGKPVVGDFDGDGFDDLLLSRPGTRDPVYFGSEGGLIHRIELPVADDARTIAIDVEGDGRDELFHHRPGSTPDRLWRLAGRTLSSSTVVPLAGWEGSSARPFAAALDGDGEDLLLIRDDGAGVRLRWNGSSLGAPQSTPSGARGLPVIADLDDNGTDDVVWVAAGPTQDWVWYGLHSGGISRAPITISGSYRPRAGDFDGSGTADLVLLEAASSSTVWWNGR